MSEYAKDKPAGFKNQTTNIAIVGGGGLLGPYIVEELLKTGQHKVTAISREGSTSKFPAGVQVKQVDYAKQESIVAALKGQDALIIIMAATAPPETQSILVEAAAKAGVSFVIPSWWGPDAGNQQMANEMLLGGPHYKLREQTAKLGVSFVNISNGFWYQFSLGGSADRFGFDFKAKSVIFFDDSGSIKQVVSTWPQIGRGVAKLLSLKTYPDDASDKTPTLSQFKNRDVYIKSFNLSQRDMLDSVLRVTGDKESDWSIKHEPAKERYQSAVAAMQGGDRSGFVRAMYARVFFPGAEGDTETKYGVQNELLGLPKEDLDTATKGALDLPPNQYS